MATFDDDQRAMTWFLPLPEPVGIPAGFTLLFQYDGRNAPYIQAGARTGVSAIDMLRQATGPLDVALRLWQVPAFSVNEQAQRMQAAQHVCDAVTAGADKVLPVELRDIPGGRKGGPSALVTVAEVAALFPADNGGDGADEQIEIDDLSHPLLRCIDCTRQVVRAYRTATHAMVADPTYVRLPKFIPTAYRQLRGDAALWTAGYNELGHANAPYSLPKMLDSESLAQWAGNIHLLSADDPQALFAERILQAQRLLKVDGTPGAALLLCSVATEALLDALLGLMLWEEIGDAPGNDGPVDEAATILSKDLRPRLRHEYSPRLGGSWDLTRPGPLANWQTHVASVRNRVVHRGYEPRPVEADEAIDASQDLNTHLADLLAKKAKRYRRTAGILIGEDGLRSRHVWQSVGAFYADQARTEGPWRENYSSWRTKVDLLVERRARN